jgi:polysaccharide biosynthesis/export protein
VPADPLRPKVPSSETKRGRCVLLSLVLLTIFPSPQSKAQAPDSDREGRVDWRAKASTATDAATPERDAFNRGSASLREYRLGTDDVIEIKVFEAPELDGKLRVSASGEISMPLLGPVRCGGMTPREFEAALAERLRAYLKEPHVGVFVVSVESHPISVLGAVKKPGVFQVRGPRTVLEMLSMAEGISDDAGESVLVMRGAGAPSQKASEESSSSNETGRREQPESEAAEKGQGNLSKAEARPTAVLNLNKLLKSEDPETNVEVYPGDVVKVVKADVIYVVGEVKRPGGFILKNDQRMSVLKAIALAEGLTSTSAKSAARILRTDAEGGQREEIPINLGKILAGKAPDPTLLAADIVFIPNSSSKSVVYKGSEAAISALTSLLIFRW